MEEVIAKSESDYFAVTVRAIVVLTTIEPEVPVTVRV
jgi:hypothetical protein